MRKVNSVNVIIPVFNSVDSIVDLTERLFEVFEGRYDLSLTLVNDGSQNVESVEACIKLTKRFPGVLLLDLSRNFGEHNAVMAGLSAFRGDCAIIMDDDLQNPPESALLLIEQFQRGSDVVYSRYESKEHSYFRNLGSRFNNLVATFLLGKPYNLYLSSYKLISPFLVARIVEYGGAYPYIDGLILRSTQNFSQVLVPHYERRKGKSNYTVKKLVSLWMRMFVNFSILPLRIASIFGFMFACVSFVFFAYVLYERAVYPSLPLGWASIMSAILFLGGVQLISIGLIGEYLGRLFLNANSTPQYIIRHIYKDGRQQDQGSSLLQKSFP